MRVMVLGAGGMLGHDLVATAPPDVELIALARAQVDITDCSALEQKVSDSRPDVIINAAAYTAVDRAEAEPDLAFRVNAEAVRNLGDLAARADLHVVHFSTDYVFDGTAVRPYREDDAPNPVNTYGASKLAGESALRKSGASFSLLRSQWLFGEHGASFPKRMTERALASTPTRVVRDQKGRPTSSLALAHATWALVARGALGVLHVANRGEATWFDLAAHIFERLGKSSLLSACTTEDFPTPARRPRYSVLDTSHFEDLLKTPLPDWRHAVDGLLDHLVCP